MSVVIVEVHFAKMTGDRYSASECYYTPLISAFVINMSFIEAFGRLRICLFHYVITVLSETSRTCYFSAVLTRLLLTMASMQLCLLQTNSSFLLRLSEIGDV